MFVLTERVKKYYKSANQCDDDRDYIIIYGDFAHQTIVFMIVFYYILRKK